MTVESRHAIPVPAEAAKSPEFLAPMTDAGITPFRAMKKLRDTGKLLPGRTLAVTGIGGLGSYGVQYAKLLGGGATVVAFARADNKLDVAKENGADHGINVRHKSTEAIPGRTGKADRAQSSRRHLGLRWQRGLYLDGVRPARPRGSAHGRRADERPRRAPAVPLRGHGAVLPRFLLG